MGTSVRSSATGLCITIVLSFLLILPASAQLYTGSIAGTVTDPSGAVVPEAQVTATDVDKGFTYTGKTDTSGRYVLRSIPPGTYSLEVVATNFERQRKTGIVLAVNQNAGVDFTLKVGAASQTVEVTAQHVELQTEDATTGQVVDRKFINDLPLVGRGVLDLAFLTPGITEVDNDCRGCMANNFTSNGSRNATADILLDGVSSTNFEQNSGILAPTYTPSVDAVEEFKVQQSNFSAEFGFTGATLINVITRSGTNQFHGSLYEFLRNEKLDANDWFSNNSGAPRSPLRLNDFGGTFGGPIIKNKTFFFFDYEGTRRHSFASNFAGVPTQSMRNGDFGELCTLNGNTFDSNGICSDSSGQIYDPYTSVADSTNSFVQSRTPIPFDNLATYASPGSSTLAGTPFNIAPNVAGNLIDPVASKLMQFYPLPNQPIGSSSDLHADWFGSGINQDSQNQFDIKIDHRFNDKRQINVKYAERRDNSHSFNCYKDEADPCTGGPVTEHDHLTAINYLQTFSPTLILNLSYGFTRGHVNQPGITGDYPNLNPVTDLGFPSYMLVSGYKQFPSVFVDQYQLGIGTQTFSIIKEGQDTHTAAGSIDWVRGKHDLKFGVEMRAHRINFTQPGWPGGSFGFDCFATAQTTDPNLVDCSGSSGGVGGDGMASFLMGIDWGNQGGLYEVPNDVATQNLQFAGFAQDNFRVTPKLTINLGLRYELSLPRTERFNRMNWLDPNLVSPFQVAGLPTFQGGEVFATPGHRWNYDSFYKAFQPRFGFAYSTSHGLVVRGGYGIYFSQPRSGAAGTGPWGYQGYDVQTGWISTFQGAGLLPGSRMSDPFRSFQPPYPDLGPNLPLGNSLHAMNDVGFDATGPILAVSRNIPYEQAWSFGFQKELPGKIIAQADYVGKKGTHLYLGGFRNLNHLGPDFEAARTSGQLTPSDIGFIATNQDTNPMQAAMLGVTNGELSDLSGPQIRDFRNPTKQFHVPFPQFDSFSGDSPPIANSIYHAAQFRVEKGFSNGLEFLVTYAISKSIDGASATDDSISWLGGGLNGDTIHVQDPNNLRAERSLSVFDIPQVLQFSYVYALPVGRGKHFGGNMHPVLNGFIGGWQLNGIWRYSKGRPIIMAEDAGGAGTARIPTYGVRPTLTGPLKKNNGSHQSMVNDYFFNACDVGSFGNSNQCPNGDPNTGVVVPTPDYTLGNAPRTYGGIRQPGTAIVNMALFKEFPMAKFREGMRMEFRMEAFNVFNHPQFGNPDMVFGDGSYGAIFSTALPAREVQLGLKFYF
jgi:hypothetical protein